MNTPNFKMVKVKRQDIFCQEGGNKPTFLLLTLSAMFLLFSCKKNIAEFPGKDIREQSISNQSSPAQVSNTVETVPFERTLFVPCGNGGAGEDVTLTGSIKFVDQVIFNDHGFTFTYHAVPQGIKDLGLSSGDTFEASGVDNGTIAGEFGEEGQYTRIFMVQLNARPSTTTQKESLYFCNKTELTLVGINSPELNDF
jgi:hypothetical protein